MDDWCLPEEDRVRGFVRPLRRVYVHITCRKFTSIPSRVAEVFALDPTAYVRTLCFHCNAELPVAEFGWKDGHIVGT